MKQLAALCYRKRRLVVVGWIALLAVLLMISSQFAGEYKTEFKLPGSESQEAFDLLKEKGVSERAGFSGQVVFQADQGVQDPAVRQRMETIFAAIERDVAEARVLSPYVPQQAYQTARDGKVAYAEVILSERPQEQYLEDAKAVKALQRGVELPGLQVELGGDIFLEAPEFSSEFIGILAAIIILLVAFGSVLAMGLPVLTALFGIGCGALLIALVTRVLAVPEFTTQVGAMIGIGVGIDYALLIVTRYRQALHDGMEPQAAVTLSLNTSGRAVVFAGLTVVLSLLGMFFLNLDFMRSLAVGAILAVLMTMLAAITLLPALLGFAGRNIDRLGLPHRAARAKGAPKPSVWYRWSRLIQAHPWPALIASTAVLLVLAAPVFSLRLGFADAGNRTTADTTRRAYDLLSSSFGPGFNGPLLVVADTPNGQTDVLALARLKSALETTPGVASVTPAQPLADGSLHLLTIFPTSAPQDAETSELVHRIRGEVVPSVMTGSSPVVRLTGLPAGALDFSDYIGDRLPVFFGAVLILSFLLLMVVFQSVVVPLKAVVMNMLSIGAAFGAMVAVFQWGFLGSLIGLGKEGPIEAWAPMMLFAIVFGLSMDYEVFLLTRVREEYDRTGDNAQAVADGLAATGRVITAAAAIMVCVFGAFILGEARELKLLGFGLAFAILIDATVVRMVLVPAAMELMGKANWWAPRWLVRLLPSVRVETVETPEREAAPVL